MPKHTVTYVRNLSLVLCLSVFSIIWPAFAQTKPIFSPDANAQILADVYAQEAVDMAKKAFDISLDWSDSSIANVEKALAMMHSSFITTNPRPTDDQAMSFAKLYGSYIGEVYRRNHGGEWSVVNLNKQEFLGLQTTAGDIFWPWGRALNRITQGPENDVAYYYRALLQRQP